MRPPKLLSPYLQTQQPVHLPLLNTTLHMLDEQIYWWTHAQGNYNRTNTCRCIQNISQSGFLICKDDESGWHHKKWMCFHFILSYLFLPYTHTNTPTQMLAHAQKYTHKHFRSWENDNKKAHCSSRPLTSDPWRSPTACTGGGGGVEEGWRGGW